MKVLFRSVWIIGFLGLLPSKVFAIDFPVVISSANDSTPIVLSPNSDDRIYVTLRQRNSYCCELRGKSLDDMPRFTEVVDFLSQIAVPSSPKGMQAPAIPAAPSHPAPDFSRLCLIAPFDADFVLPMKFGVNGTDSASSVGVLCQETTLYGSYNKASGDQNILELWNTNTERTIYSVTNVVVGYGLTYFDLTADQTLHFNLDLIPGIRPEHSNLFGDIRISHTGPAGSLKARLRRYELAPRGSLKLLDTEKFEPR